MSGLKVGDIIRFKDTTAFGSDKYIIISIDLDYHNLVFFASDKFKDGYEFWSGIRFDVVSE